MRSRMDVGDNGSKGSLVVEFPHGTSTATRPDREAPARARRRRFTARYKLRILEEAGACRVPGEVGALLRREGTLKALSRPRGPKGRRRDEVAVENEQLRKEIARLRRRLEQAQTILEIQKKASEILGIPLNRPPADDDV